MELLIAALLLAILGTLSLAGADSRDLGPDRNRPSW
jgi:hypothetical protein